MPFKRHDAHRHYIPKATYRVRNWSAYNAGLCQRGSLTVWLSPDKIDGWKASKRDGRGGQQVYSGSAIEAMLTLGTVYHLPLHQTPGLTKSVFRAGWCSSSRGQPGDALPAAKNAVDRALGSHEVFPVKRYDKVGLLVPGSMGLSPLGHATPRPHQLTCGRRFDPVAPRSSIHGAKGSGRWDHSREPPLSAKPRGGPPTRIQRD